MNRPIGSIFWYYGTLLKVVPYENNESNDCKNCYIKLRYKDLACISDIEDLHLPLDINRERDTRITGSCYKHKRKDHLNIYFKKVKELT